MTILNAKFLDWTPAEEFKKRAQIEATLFCQLFDAVDPENPKEEERLQFTTGMAIPKFIKSDSKKIPLTAGMWNLVRQFLP